jgi:hypothetical protein
MRILGMLMAVCLLQTTGFCDRKVVYQSKTSGKSKSSEWNVKTKDDGISVNSKTINSHINMELSSDLSFISYCEKTEKDRDFEIKRDGVCLFISGTHNGADVLKSYRIGKDLWVQDFKFGLQPFLKGKSRESTFHLVSPKDLDIHELVASKEIEEVIEVEGKKYKTQRVKITLKGFKKRFWKAQAWFDKETHLLVRYRSNEGPGTPYTEVTLLEEIKDHTY